MIWPLFKHELRSCALPVFAVACVLALYTGVIVDMYDPELGESLALMREAMPEIFAAFGMTDQGTTLLEFMVNYLYGFLLVVFPLVLVAMLADRLMVRHIERGSITYLLAQPVGRARLAVSQLLVLVVCLVALMVALTVFELAVAGAIIPGELAVGDLLAANASTLCLWSFFAGVCWASACALPDVTAARWAGVSLCVVFVLVKMASGVGTGLSWLADLTPLALFDPLGVAAGDSAGVIGSVALATVGLGFAAFGLVRFSQRDLSV